MAMAIWNKNKMATCYWFVQSSERRRKEKSWGRIIICHPLASCSLWTKFCSASFEQIGWSAPGTFSKVTWKDLLGFYNSSLSPLPPHPCFELPSSSTLPRHTSEEINNSTKERTVSIYLLNLQGEVLACYLSPNTVMYTQGSKSHSPGIQQDSFLCRVSRM